MTNREMLGLGGVLLAIQAVFTDGVVGAIVLVLAYLIMVVGFVPSFGRDGFVTAMAVHAPCFSARMCISHGPLAGLISFVALSLLVWVFVYCTERRHDPTLAPPTS